jgi:hypothetical protein
MPVYAALTEEDLDRTRLCSGLLRSEDGGVTWNQFSSIAGPDETSQASYEFPAVLPLNDDEIVAVMTERRLKPRPQLPLDLPQVLVRAYSTDGGQSWTQPEHLAVGAWPSLTRMDSRTIACSYAAWAAWGNMDVMFSDDGFRSIRQRLAFVEHNWLPRYSPGGWGVGWARNPIPLPPVVPNLQGDWSAGHYGFSSGLALDEEHLLLAVGQRQRGTAYTDPPHAVNIPLEKERVETISVSRILTESDAPSLKRAKSEPGSWRLVESWSVEEWQKRTGQPASTSGEAVGQSAVALDSGRWVRMQSEELIPDWHETWYGRSIGREKGYWVWRHGYEIGFRLSEHEAVSRLRVSYSDDAGKTWQKAEVETGPLKVGQFPMLGSLFDDGKGTLAVAVYGYQSAKDLSESLYTSALCRSHDGGKSWGDWSVIAYDRKARDAAYSETALEALPDGTWVALIRTENRSNIPQLGAVVSRSVSTDQGKSWSLPCPSAAAGMLASLVLPDGGLAVAGQNTCGWGLTISYNGGETWDYALPATYFPTRSGVIDEKSFWLYDEHGNIVSIYRRQ